jgi:hypothetical protein
MFNLRRHLEADPLLKSDLFDQETFFAKFTKDLSAARHSVVIESPFITTRRMNQLIPSLRRLARRDVAIYINTRDPVEHSLEYIAQDLELLE